MFFDLPPEPPKFWLPPKPAIIRSAEDIARDERQRNLDILNRAKADVRRDALNRSRRRAAGGTPPREFAWLGGGAVDTVDRTTYTFTGVNFGAEDPTRVLIMPFGWRADTPLSVTIGGVSATVGVSKAAGSNTNSAFAYAPVPTGLSGNIVVNAPAGLVRCGYTLYRAANLTDAAPVFIAPPSAGSDTSRSVSMDFPADAVGLLVTEGSSNTGTWSGATADFTSAVMEGFYLRTAQYTSTTAETGRSMGNSSVRTLSGAVWK